MIQDIAPDRLDNSYKTCDPRPDDHILFFDDEGKLYVRTESGRILFPAAKETTAGSAVFLFSIGDAGWFLAPPESGTELPGFEYKTIRELRDQGRGKELFGAFTAWHLWRWYRDNRYCGRCGGETGLHETERALQCRRCGHVVYPRINPAVIPEKRYFAQLPFPKSSPRILCATKFPIPNNRGIRNSPSVSVYFSGLFSA